MLKGHGSFILKRKDPQHHGEITLDSRVNLHHVSLDPVDQPVREDALRKRKERKDEIPVQKEFLAKRRSLMPPEKNTTITVMIGEFRYSQAFVIRTNRDMNKYRYEKKCIELVSEETQALTPTGIEGNTKLSLEAFSDETDCDDF